MLTARDVSEWMPGPGERVLCAVSGGLDSMVLLHLLRDWCGGNGGAVIAAHYNHHLRPHADHDEAFARDWCRGQDIPFVSGGGNVREYAACEGLSVEEAARKLRYAFFRREAASRQITRIYTAHHAGDNAETILLNLIRGSGLRGLSGMRHEQEGIVRPFLDVPRKELEEYAAVHGIPHVEDETNADPEAASRNLLRLKIMPLLRQLNPKAEEHVREAGRCAAVITASLEADARHRLERAEVRDGLAAVPLRDMRNAPVSVRPLMLLDLLDRLGTGRKDFGAVHVKAVLRLTEQNAGKRLDLPHGVTARIRDGWLLLETRARPLSEKTLPPGVPVRWGRYELTLLDPPDSAPDLPESIALRAARAGECGLVSVRPCPAGEYMTLPGSGGRRGIKRLCRDHRVSLAERDTLPAVYVDGHLAAVWRIGTDAAFIPDGSGCRRISLRETAPPSPFDAT